MSINTGMWHKLWSRHGLVGSSEIQKARISLGEMLTGGSQIRLKEPSGCKASLIPVRRGGEKIGWKHRDCCAI